MGTTATIFSLKPAPNTSVKFGNFLIPKKENKLIFSTSIWAHSTMKLGTLSKLLIDTFSLLTAPTCQDGQTLEALSGLDQRSISLMMNFLTFLKSTKTNLDGTSQTTSALTSMALICVMSH